MLLLTAPAGRDALLMVTVAFVARSPGVPRGLYGRRMPLITRIVAGLKACRGKWWRRNLRRYTRRSTLPGLVLLAMGGCNLCGRCIAGGCARAGVVPPPP